jgi:hypothetical protein
MKELRKHTRHNVLIPAEADTAENAVPVNVVEISVDGLRIQSKKIFSPDALMSIGIKMGRNIIFSGWVIWVLDKYLPEGHVYHTGIQIESITDADIGILGMNQREALVQEILKSGKE